MLILAGIDRIRGRQDQTFLLHVPWYNGLYVKFDIKPMPGTERGSVIPHRDKIMFNVVIFFWPFAPLFDSCAVERDRKAGERDGGRHVVNGN